MAATGAALGMEREDQRAVRSWISQNVGTIITIAVLAGGLVANFATTQYRISALEQKVERIEQKVVPPQVTEVKDQALERRLEALESRTAAMDAKLDRILINQSPRTR